MPHKIQSESGDMCGGFTGLPRKVSLRIFRPGAPQGREGNIAKKHSEKDAIGELFRVFLARYFFAALFMDR